MTRLKNTESTFLPQVEKLAPNLHKILTSKHARLTIAVTSHDVTSTYGVAFTFYLKLELLIEQCKTCGETPESAPVLDCECHRFETQFMQVADTEAPTLEKGLLKLNSLRA